MTVEKRLHKTKTEDEKKTNSDREKIAINLTKDEYEMKDSNVDQMEMMKKLYLQKNETYDLGANRTRIIINEGIWQWDDSNKVCRFVQYGSLAGSKTSRWPWNEIQDKWKELERR